MTDIELQALTVFVAHETAILNADVTKYGEAQWNPQTPTFLRLGEELYRRGVVVDACASGSLSGKQR